MGKFLFIPEIKDVFLSEKNFYFFKNIAGKHRTLSNYIQDKIKRWCYSLLVQLKF